MSKQAKTGKSSRKWLAPTVVIVVIGALSAVAFMGGSSSKASTSPAPSSSAAASPAPSSSAAASQSAQPITLARRIAGDPLALGNVNAPVVLIEYSEFQCPFCGLFTRDTQPILIKKYVQNGTLRIEWRDFPYLGAESTTAALAARAAADQGKFWEYHDALFAHQFFPNSNHLNETYLSGLAKSLGLNLAKFKTDMYSSATKAKVAADFVEGQSIGVTGTPSFLVNSTPIIGAQPLEVFTHAIDAAAAQAK